MGGIPGGARGRSTYRHPRPSWGRGGSGRAGPGGAGVGQGRRGELGCGRASLPLFLQLPLPLRASVTRGAREERSCYFSPFP